MNVTLSGTCGATALTGLGSDSDEKAAIVEALRDLATKTAAAGCTAKAQELNDLADEIEAL